MIFIYFSPEFFGGKWVRKKSKNKGEIGKVVYRCFCFLVMVV